MEKACFRRLDLVSGIFFNYSIKMNLTFNQISVGCILFNFISIYKLCVCVFEYEDLMSVNCSFPFCPFCFSNLSEFYITDILMTDKVSAIAI